MTKQEQAAVKIVARKWRPTRKERAELTRYLNGRQLAQDYDRLSDTGRAMVDDVEKEVATMQREPRPMPAHLRPLFAKFEAAWQALAAAIDEEESVTAASYDATDPASDLDAAIEQHLAAMRYDVMHATSCFCRNCVRQYREGRER